MSKKLHDIDFERSMIEKNKYAVLFRVNIPQFNSLDFDIYLHMTDGYLTLYKKVPDKYGKVIRVYFVDSVELDALPLGKIQFDRKMITYYNLDDVEYLSPGGMIQGPTGQFTLNNIPPMDSIIDLFREGIRKEPILVNDDGEKINFRKRIPADEFLGVTLKIKEYYHTGWLK